ncbi:MAG: hypothetical protein AUH29_01475 [Candidatus Rokubacteria bacterium 13_1_40CM_69_27]|nr:MAG: hypothetical protein AUH29_01475 [Candidatus Rokubacteria bacterium 13_1_40CM_69_27]
MRQLQEGCWRRVESVVDEGPPAAGLDGHEGGDGLALDRSTSADSTSMVDTRGKLPTFLQQRFDGLLATNGRRGYRH